jgi:DNA-binding MarR family transcriptional regulator
MGEDNIAVTVEAVEHLLLKIMRRVFVASELDSPLGELPLPQLRLMGMLERHGEARMSEVSDKLGVALSTATQIADRLAARGWVRRESDPEDRRVVRLMLTEEGRRLASERRAERHARLHAMLSSLEPEARARVVAGLEGLSQAARAMDTSIREPSPPPAGGALWEALALRGDVREGPW